MIASTDHIAFKRVTLADVETLQDLSKQTFYAAFAHLNHPDDIADYMTKAFSVEKLSSEISDQHSGFYFALYQDQLAGYFKLNFATAQTEFQDNSSMEIERIYVSPSYQNIRIGQSMLAYIIEQAKAKQLGNIWLGVWEHNENAIRFYERHGFRHFSQHSFMLGSDQQTDLLLRLEL